MDLRKHIVWVGLCSSCIAPGDKFDEFVDKKREQAEDTGGMPNPNTGGPVTAEQVSGTYLYVVSTVLNPGQPVVYELEVEASAVAESEELDIRLRERPLACSDRKTPVGEYGEWRESRVSASGEYTTPVIETFVPAAANAPLNCGADGTTMVTFTGTIQSPEEPGSPVEFWCGTMSGTALGGAIALNGSTFTATRITDPDNYPDVVINCAKVAAEPIAP